MAGLNSKRTNNKAEKISKHSWLWARLEDVEEDGLVLVSDCVSADDRAIRLGCIFFSLMTLHILLW